MNEEKMMDMSDEELVTWKTQSKDLVSTVFLTNPHDDEEMGLVSDLIEVAEDTFAFYAANKPDSDTAIMYTVKIAMASRKPESEVDDNVSKIKTPDIVDMNGVPLKM